MPPQPGFPSPSRGHQGVALLTNTLCTPAEHPACPAPPNLHPGPQNRAHSPAVLTLGSPCASHRGNISTPAQPLCPNTSRMAIPALGKKFLECSCSCQIQLAPKSSSGILPGMPGRLVQGQSGGEAGREQLLPGAGTGRALLTGTDSKGEQPRQCQPLGRCSTGSPRQSGMRCRSLLEHRLLKGSTDSSWCGNQAAERGEVHPRAEMGQRAKGQGERLQPGKVHSPSRRQRSPPELKTGLRAQG